MGLDPKQGGEGWWGLTQLEGGGGGSYPKRGGQERTRSQEGGLEPEVAGGRGRSGAGPKRGWGQGQTRGWGWAGQSYCSVAIRGQHILLRHSSCLWTLKKMTLITSGRKHCLQAVSALVCRLAVQPSLKRSPELLLKLLHYLEGHANLVGLYLLLLPTACCEDP